MPYRPVLSQATINLTREVEAVDERGRTSTIAIPAERPLTVYVDKRELVTLMTLGGAPEALTLGYLRNQRLVRAIEDIESVQVDWEVEAVAVKTRHGIADIEQRTARKVVTTGCGQGSVFGGLLNFPYFHWDFIQRWLAPVLPASIVPERPRAVFSDSQRLIIRFSATVSSGNMPEFSGA